MMNNLNFLFKPLIAVLLVVFSAGLSHPAVAGETQMSEREHLARVLHELDAIKPILLSAQRAPKNPGRTRFKYKTLLRDLNLMRQGLDEYIQGTVDQPRQTVRPLSGSYTQ